MRRLVSGVMAGAVPVAVERGDVDELIRLVDSLCPRLGSGTGSWSSRPLRASDRARSPVVAGCRPRRIPPRPRSPGPLCGHRPGRGGRTFRTRSPAGGRGIDTRVGRPRATRPAGAAGGPRRARMRRPRRGPDRPDAPRPAGAGPPFAPRRWEPEYYLAHYRHDGVDLPGPPPPALEAVDAPTPAPSGTRDPAADALLDAVRAWTEGSEGRAEAITVRRRTRSLRSRRSDATGCASQRSLRPRPCARSRRRARAGVRTPAARRGGRPVRRMVGGRRAHGPPRGVARSPRSGTPSYGCAGTCGTAAAAQPAGDCTLRSKTRRPAAAGPSPRSTSHSRAPGPLDLGRGRTPVLRARAHR